MSITLLCSLKIFLSKIYCYRYVCSCVCLSLSLGLGPIYAQKPNVILILTDDQGYGEIAAHGNPHIKTPAMDKLYHTGVRLDNFHVNSVCSPSRAALITGMYASHVGVWNTTGGRNILDKKAKIAPQFFKEAGYKTALIGKWHLGDGYPYRPEDRGFDEVFRIGAGSLGQVADYWGNGLWDGYYFTDNHWVSTKGFSTDVQFNRGIAFVEKNKEQPFFLTLATTAPHAPIGAAEKYVAPYEAMGLKSSVAKFYGMVTNIDANIARLRDKLDVLGISENTILVFMSDNGSANDKSGDSFNAGMRGKKGSLYEGGHRVPCFLYWPKGGWVGGKQLNQLTAHIDILPTLLNACDLSVTAKKDNITAFDGIALNSYIKAPSKPLDRYLITESKVKKRKIPFESSVVLHDQWRLVKGTELYDVEKDGTQIENRCKKHPQVIASLQQHYKEWYRKISYQFDAYMPFGINSLKTTLYSMDLYKGEMTAAKSKAVWNQKSVLKGTQYRGFWKVDCTQKGRYKIRMCRWPERLPFRLRNGPKKAKHLDIVKAQVALDGVERTKFLKGNEKDVAFVLDIPEGVHTLQADFTNRKEEVFSAYYVYIEKVL